MRSPLTDGLRFTSSWPIHYVRDDPLPQILHAFDGSTFYVRTVELVHVNNLRSLIDVLIASIGLPSYTGLNLDALIDSLRDVPKGHDGYILVAYDAASFWSRNPKLGLDFVGCWASAACYCLRTNTPFHLVFVD
jgi:hypothetical protein